MMKNDKKNLCSLINISYNFSNQFSTKVSKISRKMIRLLAISEMWKFSRDSEEGFRKDRKEIGREKERERNFSVIIFS